MHQNFAFCIFATLIVKLANISIPTVLKWRWWARINCSWARWWTWRSWEPKGPPRWEHILNILHCKFLTMSTEFDKKKNISDSNPDYTDHKKRHWLWKSDFDSYFWPFNKSYVKTNAIFVISAMRVSIWNVFIKLCRQDEKLTIGIGAGVGCGLGNPKALQGGNIFSIFSIVSLLPCQQNLIKTIQIQYEIFLSNSIDMMKNLPLESGQVLNEVGVPYLPKMPKHFGFQSKREISQVKLVSAS